MRRTVLLISTLLIAITASAQLSQNPDKFLGNITTGWASDMDVQGVAKYYTMWNQVTPENATKWGQVEGTKGSYNWVSANKPYDYAHKYGFPFKFHTLVWGSQYPSWMNDLSTKNQYKAIVNWFDEVKSQYPDLEMIDVVNEAVAGHAPAPFKEALGGDGQTGYDWIIKAFEMAHERWPNAILIYNDYNTFQWQRSQFIDLVRTLRDAGAPIDAYGCQSHDLYDMSLDDFKAAMKEIQDAVKMPMYITEYDISSESDAEQLKRYKEQLPVMWEADYCAGVTIWGYIYGQTWDQAKYSGLIKNGVDRDAMTWLRDYMASDVAKNAKSPFPGMKKEASVYIKPSTLSATVNQPTTITVRASMRTKTIKSVTLKYKSKYTWKEVATLTQAPYVFNYTPTILGQNNLQAVVTTTDGETYVRYGAVNAYNPREPYKSMSLPGTIQAEDFDKSGEGVTFHDSDSQDEGGVGYRTDNEGVDIVRGNNGYALGYTASGEWYEYTVDVKSSGTYSYTATVSSGNDNTGFRIGLMKNGVETPLATVSVTNTGSWDTYETVNGTLEKGLGTGPHILRFTITGAYCNIDKVKFDFVSDVKYVTKDDEYANGTRYNFGGQRVNEYKRGMTIMDGKKVYIVK